MNERIKELEKLATEVEHSHGAFGEYEKYYRLNTKKFAELIVRECASLCEARAWGMIEKGFPGHEAVEECSDIIKQHFGVEE